MQPIQIVCEVLNAIDAHDLNKAAKRIAEGCVVRDTRLPRTLDKATFLEQMRAILAAFPDWKYDLDALDAEGETVTVNVIALATHSAPLRLPGQPAFPATNKHIRVPDHFIFTVRNELVTALKIDSPPDGGAAAMLSQLGMTLTPPQS